MDAGVWRFVAYSAEAAPGGVVMARFGQIVVVVVERERKGADVNQCEPYSTFSQIHAADPTLHTVQIRYHPYVVVQ